MRQFELGIRVATELCIVFGICFWIGLRVFS